MTDKDLIDMGLRAKGDRVKLKAFCQSGRCNDDERAMKKRKLKEILEAGKVLRLPDSSSRKKQQNTPNAVRKETLKFEVRWKHLYKDVGYKMKRAEQGGGVRSINIKRDISAQGCLEELKKVFFPNDQARMNENLLFELADFQCQPIDLQSSFSPESYKSQYCLHNPRLFLPTKERQTVISSDGSDNEEELLRSVFSPSMVDDNGIVEDKIDNTIAPPSGPNASSLIGTSDERQNLMNQIMSDYNTSLKADEEKELRSAQEESRKEELRKRRESRVPSEPKEGFPFVVVSVRHPMFGVIRRRFRPGCKVRAVYDWVGSLANTPEDFSLSLPHPRKKVVPDDDISLVSSSVLHMSEEDCFLIHEEDVPHESYLHRQHVRCDSEQENKPSDDIYIVEDISPTLPTQLLEEDEDTSIPDNKSPTSLFISLTDKRKKASKNLCAQECKIYEVDRHNCFEDLLTLYKEESLTTKKHFFTFQKRRCCWRWRHSGSVFRVLEQFYYNILRRLLPLYSLHFFCSLAR